MAHDPFNFFRFRSRKDQEKEEAAYAAWAFPYGAAQKERVQALLKQLVPQENASIAMVLFLAGKEAFLDRDGKWEGKDAARRDPLREAATALRLSGIRVKKQHMPLYLALVVADSQIDERLLYPETEELLAMAAELGEI